MRLKHLSTIIIWNCKKLGHIVCIINSHNRKKILTEVRNFKPNFVDIQYDDFADLATELSHMTKVVAITSHFGYLEQRNEWHTYENVFQTCILHKSENILSFRIVAGNRKRVQTIRYISYFRNTKRCKFWFVQIFRNCIVSLQDIMSQENRTQKTTTHITTQ